MPPVTETSGVPGSGRAAATPGPPRPGGTPAGSSARVPALRVAVSDEPLGALRAQWDALYRADPRATPFVAPGFGGAWLRHWADGVAPWLLTIHEDEALVGLAPMVLRRRGVLRTLMPLGFYVGNYWDVLARPDRRGEVGAAVAEELARRRGEWDALVLDTLPPGSALPAALRRAGLRVRGRGSRPYPGLGLPASFDDYLGGMGRVRRRELRRRLRPLGGGGLELVEVHEPAELDAAVTTFQELRAVWWQTRGKTLNPDHTRPEFAAFLRALLRELVPAGRAVARELRDGDRVLGVTLDLRDDTTFYAWLNAYHPDIARLSPGKMVMTELIRSAIAGGITYFDFMVGDEPYKYDFGAIDRHVPRLLAGSGTVRSDAALAAALAAERRRAR